MLAIITNQLELGNYNNRKKLEKSIFLDFVFEFFEKIEYIGIERNAKKKEVENEKHIGTA